MPRSKNLNCKYQNGSKLERPLMKHLFAMSGIQGHASSVNINFYVSPADKTFYMSSNNVLHSCISYIGFSWNTYQSDYPELQGLIAKSAKPELQCWYLMQFVLCCSAFDILTSIVQRTIEEKQIVYFSSSLTTQMLIKVVCLFIA